jgi:NAD+ kinase
VVEVLDRMEKAGLSLLLTPDLAEFLEGSGHKVRWDVNGMDLSGLDAIISLGGDGSMLDTVRVVERSQVPILGINLGRLGYLSNVRLEGLEAAVEALQQGRFTLEDRSLVEVSGCGPEVDAANFALNEVSIHKRDSSSMITLHAYLGERFLNTYWADGLIVATPTGSTAYSLSCGGPLLDPTCKDLVITPIAPHNLNVRPLVVPDHHTIRLVVETRNDNYLLNLDSRSVTLEEDTEIVIRRAPFTVRLVQFHEQDFLDTLRTKLTWGLDARSSPPKG